MIRKNERERVADCGVVPHCIDLLPHLETISFKLRSGRQPGQLSRVQKRMGMVSVQDLNQCPRLTPSGGHQSFGSSYGRGSTRLC